MILAAHLAVVVTFALLFTGCGTAPGSPEPSPSASATSGTAQSSPQTGGPWLMADVFEPSITIDAPSLQPGYQCHPCHSPEENEFFGVGMSGIGAIAVGVQQPPAKAVAYARDAAGRWVPIAGFVGEPGTAAQAIASSESRSVIVGQKHGGATAWSAVASAQTWTESPTQESLQVAYSAGAMTSIAADAGGFIAGGYREDPLHASASAAIWRSNDGLTWQLDDATEAFRGGRIWGVAANAHAVVAVGTNGDPNYGPAAAWRWTSDGGWARGHVGPTDRGAMRAVAATSSGFVAVGQNGTDKGAMTWTSEDGLDWTAAPDQTGFHYFDQPVRMQAVVATKGGLVAAGWRSDAGKGSAVTWTSADGTTWQSTWQTSFSGGQISGLALDGGSIVAAGRTGYPDWNEATIWTAPADHPGP
jgi:hypothetical protein